MVYLYRDRTLHRDKDNLMCCKFLQNALPMWQPVNSSIG